MIPKRSTWYSICLGKKRIGAINLTPQQITSAQTLMVVLTDPTKCTGMAKFLYLREMDESALALPARRWFGRKRKP